MNPNELKEFLDAKVQQYNSFDFIAPDPISIPHKFSVKEDIEISGFLAATIAWGNRKSILKNANKMMDLLGNSPYDFVMNHQEHHLENLDGFVHRTFNAIDFSHFIKALKHIYTHHNGLENIFNKHASKDSLQPAIHELKKIFFEIEHPSRATKHVSDPYKKSACKRINMWLRWMIRNDNTGVDFGLWKNISPAILSCPLDVHSGNVGRKLGLLTRKQNDAKALLELDTSLRKLDSQDPVKYDFALFGLGVFEKF
ncbi:TIGR02757 family protein [Tenacibaculum finnmarkense]|uniref:TIGR02757 family protein n=1 Tax=Tenacibaculum finnmarkense TaxID=2781243 RepID=UPI001E58321A|nr:TIGR02757 family protein [Tenacibaculum finnmarkense]MCD8413021.1 TIGR02757 family protein [Tenacibaculum finnmarkense genomovar ulcerans]MCG8207770.1 TIGR02757 family protein [Tenacibaculum finnmarkense genomovar finnmarkense]MCG8723842.1 TIGR02757 family protein [Tenacibaculum finnmarkense]MCG8742174.1 TIGR02757 family protein [Tenacibaculum finnmarkense]MCG8765513.1 TIGR02757 family protein [Tenacibaculum finnmarkense]